MDYVCTPQPGFPFVGKNCEWPVVAKCLAGNTIHVDIPEEAIDAYELSINNGILHGCNRADFMCDAQTRTCGPVKKADFNGKYSLDCTTSSMQSINGVFTFSQVTHIFSNKKKPRKSDICRRPWLCFDSHANSNRHCRLSNANWLDSGVVGSTDAPTTDQGLSTYVDSARSILQDPIWRYSRYWG